MIIANFSFEKVTEYILENDNATRLPPKLPDTFIPLTKSVIDGVERFVFFVGYPRSGHSIIGSFMDSHPNMIIGHEYPLFKKIANRRKSISKNDIFNSLYKSSYIELVSGWRGKKNLSKGYSLAIDGMWQAVFDKLKVIGNKQGGGTAQFYRKYPDSFLSAMDYLATTIDIPIYLVHVVRNPFDMIATQALFLNTAIRGLKSMASENRKFNNPNLLMSTAKDMLGRAAAVAKLISILKRPVLEIHHEDLIQDPVSTMRSICTFVGVECPDYYLKACKNNTYSSLSKSRHTVVWPPAVKEFITKQKNHFIFFQRYSFVD